VHWYELSNVHAIARKLAVFLVGHNDLLGRHIIDYSDARLN